MRCQLALRAPLQLAQVRTRPQRVQRPDAQPPAAAAWHSCLLLQLVVVVVVVVVLVMVLVCCPTAAAVVASGSVCGYRRRHGCGVLQEAGGVCGPVHQQYLSHGHRGWQDRQDGRKGRKRDDAIGRPR